MIIFRKVRFKNFLGFGNNFTEIELDRSQVTLVTGKNGGGKSSSLLDSITFALFKKPFRDINLPQLINSINQKQCVVEIEFSVGSLNYKIIRGMKPNIFEVYENNVLKNPPSDKTDYQKVLEEQILKCDYETFVQVVILGSASYIPFMELTVPKRRTVIEDILVLEIFSVMNVLLKSKIVDNKTVLDDIDTQRKVIQANIKSQHQHIADSKINNSKLIQEKQDIIEKTRSEIEELNKTVKAIKNELETLDIKDNSELNKDLRKLQSAYSTYQTELKLLNKEYLFYNDNDACPTCKQDISEEFKLNEINIKKTSIDSKEKKLNLINAKMIEISNLIDENLKATEFYNSKERQYNSTLYKVNSSNEYILSLEKDILNLNKLTVGNAEELIKVYEKELSELNDKYDETFNYRNLLSSGSILLKDTGIKAKIIKKFIPIMNKLINDYLSKMDFMCEFILDENFSETIKSRYRDIFSYNSFSQGEKQRIDLAILFSFREIARKRNSINTNLLIFDEILDGSLDTDGVDNFIQSLQRLTNDNNCFIITHSEKQMDTPLPRITFEKQKGFSVLK